MRKIMQSAKMQNCTVRLPDVCNGDPQTTVFAHVNGVRFGNGMGIKSKQGAYCCSACHDAIDKGIRPSWMSKQDVLLAHYEGVIETNTLLIERGLIKIL